MQVKRRRFGFIPNPPLEVSRAASSLLLSLSIPQTPWEEGGVEEALIELWLSQGHSAHGGMGNQAQFFRLEPTVFNYYTVSMQAKPFDKNN